MRNIKCLLWLDVAQSAYQVEEQILFRDYFHYLLLITPLLVLAKPFKLCLQAHLKQILLTGAVPKTLSSSVKLYCSPTHTPSFKMVLTPTAAWMLLL